MASSPGSQTEINAFFDAYYDDHHRNPRAQGWRALAAGVNADLFCPALERVHAQPRRTIEIGCGDGAVLAELSHRGVGGSLVGYEIADSVVEYARARALPNVEKVEVFDGEHLPEPDGSFDMALIVNVLEHSHRPEVLLREAARVASVVVVQIVLTRTLLARRSGHRKIAERTGHRHDLDPRGARKLLGTAGLAVLDESVTLPPLSYRAYWAATRGAQLKAVLAGAVSTLAPPLAGQLLSRDYTAVCRAGEGAADLYEEAAAAAAPA